MRLNFLSTIQNILVGNNKSFIGQALTGAGLGLLSIAIFHSFIDYYQTHLLSYLGNLGAVAGILGIAKVDKAISVIIGSHLASVYIKTFASGLRITKKTF